MQSSDRGLAPESQNNNDLGFDETIAVPISELPSVSDHLVPSVGIIWHPDFSRIGDVAPLFTGQKKKAEISRNTPEFKNLSSETKCPLLDRRVSRSPVQITEQQDGKFLIEPPVSKMAVMVNGRAVEGPVVIGLDELGSDIVITLSNSVVLSVFMGPSQSFGHANTTGLLGVSAQIQKVHSTIEHAGPTGLPVLVRGETGTGKELVAQAIHATSDRAAEELISVNMATLSSELGAADLFGASKGAFTGAVRDRMGLFEQATNSTIFLDEIGDTPTSIQAMLLRTLETGEYRRVGETRVRHTDARVIAATDRPLDPERFSQPLLRRLENISITMAPLRDRRVDIGVMIIHFLQQQDKLGLVSNLAPWIANLVLYSWPGNVRELRNVVQQMTINHVPDVLQKQPEILSSAAAKAEEQTVKPKKEYRATNTVTEDEILDALNDSGWSVKEAADTLNISRTVLYSLMDKSPNIRRADELDVGEIKAAIAGAPDDLDSWAKELKVSKEALRRRILQLELN